MPRGDRTGLAPAVLTRPPLRLLLPASLPEILDHLLAEPPLADRGKRHDHVLSVAEVVGERAVRARADEDRRGRRSQLRRCRGGRRQARTRRRRYVSRQPRKNVSSKMSGRSRTTLAMTRSSVADDPAATNRPTARASTSAASDGSAAIWAAAVEGRLHRNARDDSAGGSRAGRVDVDRVVARRRRARCGEGGPGGPASPSPSLRPRSTGRDPAGTRRRARPRIARAAAAARSLDLNRARAPDRRPGG